MEGDMKCLKSINADHKNDIDPEEQKADTAAALMLYSWQFCKTSASVLEKRDILGGTGIQYPPPQVSNHQHVEIPQSEDIGGTILPELPPIPALNGLIGECSKPYKKTLTESDVDKGQSRFALHKGHAVQYILPLLGSIMKDNLKGDGIPVTVYDSEGKGYEMRFKLWGTKMYVLMTTKWNEFCDDHNFDKYDVEVTYWMFRHNRIPKFCFALTWRLLGPRGTKPPVKRISGGENRSEKRRRNS